MANRYFSNALDRLVVPLGPSSVFGLENPLGFFSLLSAPLWALTHKLESVGVCMFYG